MTLSLSASVKVFALLALVAVVSGLRWPSGYGGAAALADTAMGPTALPDLVVESIADAQQPFDCVTPAGVKVTVRNVGGGAAVASTTFVSSGAQHASLPTQALAAGEAVTFLSTVQGIPFGDTYTAEADFSDNVAESDETNNTRVEFLSLGTLPTCTPTPTNTPAPVGGVAELPDAVASPLSSETAQSESMSWAAAAGIAAVCLVAAGGAAWYARRRG